MSLSKYIEDFIHEYAKVKAENVLSICSGADGQEGQE